MLLQYKLGAWIDSEDGTYTAEEGDTLYDLYGDDWQDKSGFTRDPRTLQVGESVGIKNQKNEHSQASEERKSQNQRTYSQKDFFCFSYMPMENIGLNGGTNYSVFSLLGDDQLDLFATGNFVASHLVNDFVVYGSAELVVDGKSVEKKSFSYPQYDFLWSGNGKVLGDGIFNYDFTKSENISVNFKFGIMLEQDSQRYHHMYGEKNWRIK